MRTGILVFSFSAILLIACGDGGGSNPTPTPSGSPQPTGTPEPTFSWVQSNVLPRCTGPACHGSTSTAPITNYNQVVGAQVQNTTGACSATDQRVVPSDATPTVSILYGKMLSTPPCGTRMPQLSTPLTAAEIAAVETWITNGAQNN